MSAAVELLAELADAGVTIQKAAAGGWRLAFAAGCQLTRGQRRELHEALVAVLPTLVDDVG